ncbi:MAG TPA: oxygen-independent coproporphyrinogen III oxidase [Deinococcales bacterium]|nr:oxygen-independent coproporphyrinogen III oxidase [Deinococcales bacterium]
MTMHGPHVDVSVLQKYDKPGPRYTSYPTAVEFHSGFTATDYEARLAAANLKTDRPWSLYTHLPFCEARCHFCACHVIISPHKHEVGPPYLQRLYREVEMVAARVPDRREVSQFHWGGGTPTYFEADDLVRLFRHYKNFFSFRPDAEIALEVDPRVTTFTQLDRLAAEGFNRMSMGVQDFDPRVQEAINRVQSFEQTRDLMVHGRSLGMRSINIDLIYGLPFQTPESFSRTLEQALALSPDRVAVYSFALVPWIKAHQKYLSADDLPDPETKLELLVEAREAFMNAGYVDIGMDHFAKPDDSLSVAQREGRLWRNFMGYTNLRAEEILAFGVSGIGYVDGAFVQNVKKLSEYDEALSNGRLPVERGYALSSDDLARQRVIQELMCNFVVNKRAVEAEFGLDFDDYFAPDLALLAPLAEEGLVSLSPEKVQAQGYGKLFVRNIAMQFDRYLREKPREKPTFSRTV